MDIREIIKKEGQIKKFCMYGFFKNLRFFEPYLLIYFAYLGFDLFEIGVLMSIQAGMTYAFEVPSAIVADYFGKKNELMMCFAFYIISFVLLFIGCEFWLVALGMVFFGLGEAFRSGTHKAMILGYLEHRGWYEHKGFVYGRTRSYSLTGSAISAFLSILLVLQFNNLRWIFAVSIVPYILDFILIATYPEYLNERQIRGKKEESFRRTIHNHMKGIIRNVDVMKVITSSATYDGVFKILKDYIQPILSVIIFSAGFKALDGLDHDQMLKVILGVVYGFFYLFSAQTSKQMYKVTGRFGENRIYDLLFDLFGGVLILLSFTIKSEQLFVTVVLYFVLYLMKDARRPTFLEVSSNYMKKSERVTVLSMESQLRAVLMMIFGPLFGLVAETFSISFLFLVLGCVLILGNRVLKIGKRDCT